MEILIAGDLVPINSNESLFIDGDLKNHFSEFEATFNLADLFIANLECPLTHHNEKINKSGPVLKGKPKTVSGIAKLNVKLASLANNHMGDYGETGVKDTIELLKQHKINTIGAGDTFEQAKAPYIYEKDGVKVGVLSYADYEFGMVTDAASGSNPFSFINAYNDISILKTKVDYIITLLHDGKEYYPYPSPDLQQICRHLIDLGADVVVCQHSHIIGSVESYKDSTIVYGQGNFIFDYRNNKTSAWSHGFFIKIQLNKDENRIKLVPFKQNYPGICKLDTKEETLFHETLRERSEQISDETFIKATWLNFIRSQQSNYFSAAFGHTTLIGRILKKLRLSNCLISNTVALIVLNFLRSRVHRESLISILEEKIKR